MRRPDRAIALALAGLSLVALAVSAWGLARRIDAWNEAHARPIYYFFPVDQTSFTFAGKPVTISDELDDRGEGEVTIRYADESLVLKVRIPNPLPLPGLDRHTDWLRFHVFAEGTGRSYPDFRRALDAGEITSRLVAVVRIPHAPPSREGRFSLETEEDWGWGEVRRDRWAFQFHEFLPEGGWRSETLRFPESGQSFYRRQVRAEMKGEPPPERAPDELEESSWQFQAALPLMNRPPAITHEQQALRNAGLTLPVASASIVVFMLSLAFALAPRRPPAPSE